MTSKPTGGPAFPYTHIRDVFDHTNAEGGAPGMTLRDYFAAQALAAFPIDRGVDLGGLREYASHAYTIADFMLEIRET